MAALIGDLYNMAKTDTATQVKQFPSFELIRKKEAEQKEKLVETQERHEPEAKSNPVHPVPPHTNSSVEEVLSQALETVRLWKGEDYHFLPQEAKAIQALVNGADDPAAEVDRFLASQRISAMSGIDIGTVYSNLDDISKYYTGNSYIPNNATFAQKIKAGFNTVEAQVLMEQYRKAVLSSDKAQMSTMETRIQDMLDEIGGIQAGIPQSWLDRIGTAVWGNLGYISDIFMHSTAANMTAQAGVITAAGVATKLGVPIGASALATGGTLGTLTGIAATAALPITAVAASWGIAAGTIASFARSKELATAQSFWDMMHSTDPELRNPVKANLYANINGLVVGLTEALLDGVTSRGVAIVSGKLPKTFGVSTLVNLNASGDASRMVQGFLNWFSGGIDEAFLNEFPQQISDYLTKAAYRSSIGLPSDFSFSEMVGEAWDAAIDGFIVGAVYGFAEIPSTMRALKDEAITLRMIANEVKSKEEFMKRTKDMKPEGVPRKDYEIACDQIFTAARAAQSDQYAGTVVESEGIATNELDAGKRITENDGSIQRLRDGKLYHTDVDNGTPNESSNLQSREMRFGSPSTGARYGVLDYSVDAKTNQITIDELRVDYGYESIRSEAIKDLSEAYPGYRIEWNPQTEQLQSVKDELVANNPNGKEKGLTYYDGVSTDVDDRMMIQTAIRKNMPRLAEAEIFVASDLLMLRAEAKGMTGKQYVDTYFSEGIFGNPRDIALDGNRGAVRFGDDAKALIYASRNSDFSTWVHETFHVAVREMDQKHELSQAVREAAASADFKTYLTDHAEVWGNDFDVDGILSDLASLGEDWTRSQEENVARIYEAWLADRKTAITSPKLRQLFNRIAKFMQKIYRTIRQSVPLDERISNGFESLYRTNPDLARTMAAPRQGTAQAERSGLDTLFQNDDSSMSQVRLEHTDTETRLRANPNNFDSDGNHLAPNGKPSNLTYEQWVQVRTPAFKKWFGDWEKDAKIRRCLESEAIDTHEIPIDWSQDRMSIQRAVKDWAKDNIRGDYYNADTATNISVTGKSIAEVLHHDTGVTYDDTQLKSVAYIPEIIQRAVHLDMRTNESQRSAVSKYDYFLSVIQIDGTDYLVRSVVAENLQGQKYYDHKLTKKEDFQKRYWITSPGFSSESSLSDLNDKRLLQILQDNSSKVVDENGEPQVVYHGTSEIFNIFDRNKLGSSTDASSARLGFFFTDNIDIANGYGIWSTEKNAREMLRQSEILERQGKWSEAEALSSRAEEIMLNDNQGSAVVMPLFLSMKNPLLLDAKGDDFTHFDSQLAEMSATGYDGIIVRNLDDNIDGHDIADHFVVFESTQIKSATDNRGTFDGENPNILFQTAKVDDEYFKALDEGDIEKAQRIVDDQARLKGYLSNDDYRMMHHAPTAGNDLDVNLVALAESDLVPADYWEHPERYGIQYETGGWESFNKIKRAMDSVRNGKSPSIRFYRAVPATVKEDYFRNGDWITPSKTYAVEHAKSNIDGPYRIIARAVKASDAWGNADSINEWGYNDGKNYAYRNTRNNRKLLDVITHDEEGNIIPPSKRFNYRNYDVLFQTANGVADEILHEAQGFDSWDEFKNYYEAFVFDSNELPPDSWFIDVWEKANKITESMPEPARIIEGTEAEKDTQFINLLSDDMELDGFIETVGDILNDDTFKQGRFADQEEYDAARAKDNLKARFKAEAAHNIKVLANKVYRDQYALTIDDRNAIRKIMSKERQVRYYRDLYAAVMDRSDLVAQIIDENLPEIDSPEYYEVSRMSISERIKYAEDIEDGKLRDAVLSGKGGLEENAERVLRKTIDEKKALEKKINKLKEELDKADRRYAEEATEARKLFEKDAAVRDKLNYLSKLINQRLEEGARISDRQLKMRGSLQHEADILQSQIAKLTDYRNKYKNEQDKTARRDNRIKQLTRQVEELKAKIETTRADLNADNRKNVNLLLGRLADARKQMEKLSRETAIDQAEAIARAKAELNQRWKQERLARQLRDYAQSLKKQIFVPPGDDIIHSHRAMIYAIQARIDPKSFIYQNRKTGKFITYGEYEALVKLVGEDDVRTRLGDRLYDIMKNRVAKAIENGYDALESWDVVELERLASEVQRLRQEGRQLLESKRIRERILADADRLEIINSMISTPKSKFIQLSTGYNGYDFPAPVGTIEARKKKMSFRERRRSAYYVTLTMSRKAQLLDGDKKGKVYDLLVTEKRKHRDAWGRNMHKRTAPIYKALQDAGKTVNDLYTQVPVELQWGFKATYTLADLMYVYASKNESKNQKAVAWANLVSDAEKERIGHDDEQIESLGYARFDQLWEIAKTRIEDSGLMPVFKAIENDLGSRSDEYQRILIEIFNNPMEKVAYYLPLDRLASNGKDIEELNGSSLFNRSTGKQKSSLDTGSAIQRIEMAPDHQLPVNLDLFQVWYNSVQEQEYVIEFGEYIKHIETVFQGRGSRDLNTYIRGTYGDSLLQDIEAYVNDLYRPYEFKQIKDDDRLLRALRGNLGSAYLAWKMSGVVLQAITSPAPFLSELNPKELISGYLKLFRNYAGSWDFIVKKSQMMKDRSMNTIIDDLHKAMASGTQNKAKRALNKFNDVGVMGLEITDRVCVSGGWLAAYDKEYARLVNKEKLSDTEADVKAIQYADDFVLRVQPTGDRTELAPLFTMKGEAWKAFTQFQTALNVIWNNIAFDLPQFIRHHEYSKAVGTIAGYVLAGVILGAVSDGFDDDDKDLKDKMLKLLYWGTTQFTGAFPLLGNYVDNATHRLLTGDTGYTTTTMYPAIDKMFSATNKAVAGNIPGAAANLAEGFGLFLGLPTSGTKEAIRIFTDTPLAPLGRRN